jgi:hypothetical protein
VRYSDRVDARHVTDARTTVSRELVQAYADDAWQLMTLLLRRDPSSTR